MKGHLLARGALLAALAMGSGFLFAQSVDPVQEPPTDAELQPDIPTDVTTTNFQEEYGRVVGGGESVSAIELSQFGESVDLSTGKTEFTAMDVSLPGNNAIPVAFGRTRSVENHGGTFARVMGDWDMDIPYMEGVFIAGQGWVVDVPGQAQQRCSAPTIPAEMSAPYYNLGPGHVIPPKEYWQGIHLHAPGQGRQEVLFAGSMRYANPMPEDGFKYRYSTSGRWYLTCDGGLPNG